MTPGLTHTLANLSAKMRVFVSSVQDELVNERTAILELVNTDSFLSKHVEAVLFEHQPARTLPAEDAYLSDLETCDVYMGIGDEAGKLAGQTYQEGKLYYLFLKSTEPSLFYNR